MDIEIQNTPKKTRRDPYSTPPHSNQRLTPIDAAPSIFLNPCETPPKKQNRFQTPRKSPWAEESSSRKTGNLTSGIKRKENPQSRKQKRSPIDISESPSSGDFEITPFSLSRLEQDYEIVQGLGNGHFSEVGLYRSRLTEELFAIKTAKANKMSVNEVQALGSLWVMSGQCPNVVRYYHSWIQDGELFLVMEYCQESLQKQISKYRMSGIPIPEKVIVNYLRAALLGLDSIHKHGILHLDVKPENLLFKASTLKIADFGLSRAVQIRSGDIEEGDSRYLAKEVLNIESGVDLTKADIFSLGMTAYEMLTLEVLPNNGEHWRRVREVGISVEGRMDLTGYSSMLLSMVQSMGAARWQNRPSAAQLLQLPLFKQSRGVLLMSNGRSNKKQRQSSL